MKIMARLNNRYNTMKPEFPISRKNMAKVLLAFVGNKGVKE